MQIKLIVTAMAGIAAAAVTKRATESGDLTYYGGGLGACGWNIAPGDVAISLNALFGPQTPGGNPNNNPLCGKTIQATANGITKTLRVADSCAGCARGDLDVLEGDFTAFGYSLAQGRVSIQWENALGV